MISQSVFFLFFFTFTSQGGLLLWIRGTESCVGRTGKQKQKCCYGVGFESTLYVSRYQTCVGKVGGVVIHPTFPAPVTFLCTVFDLENHVSGEIRMVCTVIKLWKWVKVSDSYNSNTLIITSVRFYVLLMVIKMYAKRGAWSALGQRETQKSQKWIHFSSGAAQFDLKQGQTCKITQ